MVETSGAALQPAPLPRTMYLYAGSAVDTIKPGLLHSLPWAAVGRFPTHRAARILPSSPEFEDSLRNCARDGFEWLIVVVDAQTDGLQRILTEVFASLAKIHRAGALRDLRAVEIFAAVGDDDATQLFLGKLVPLWRSLEAPPYFKSYLLSSPEVLESSQTSRALLISFISAVTSAAHSRMARIGLGLSGIRTSRECALFLAHYTESPWPATVGACKAAVDREMFARTFSILANDPAPGLTPEELERLLGSYDVGKNEPTSYTSSDFSLLRFLYRDNLLHRLLSGLVRQVPDCDEFLKALDSLAASMNRRSLVLGSLLYDVGNELVAVRRKNDSGDFALGVEDSGVPEYRALTRDLAERLARRFRFPLWPLLPPEVRPKSASLKPLYEEYESCVDQLHRAIRDSFVLEVRHRLAQMQMRANRVQVPPVGGPRASVFAFLHESVAKDTGDELWPHEQRYGLLALLKRELRA